MLIRNLLVALSVCALTLVKVNCFSQASVTGVLVKGATVPDIPVTIQTGLIKENFQLSHFNDKLILLDFWGINCVDCISSMPELLALQTEFHDQLKIILVTTNTSQQISELFNKFDDYPPARKWIAAGNDLSFITADTFFNKLFPHKGIPTHVWIDRNRIFRTIAYNSSTKRDNIRSILNGEKVQLDEVINREIDVSNPLSWLDSSISSGTSVPVYSFISRHIEAGDAGSGYFKFLENPASPVPVGISCINYSVSELYKIAYKTWLPSEILIPDNRIIIETKNKNIFYPPVNDPDYNNCWKEWFDSNTFCYGSKLPGFSKNQIFERMRSDLDTYFRLRSRIQRRIIRCIVLKQTNNGKSLSSKKSIVRYEQENNQLVIQHLPIQEIYNSLENIIRIKYPLMPFFNELSSTGTIDITLPIPSDLNKVSIPLLERALKQNGLSLVIEARVIEMLVITEKQ